jgi:hypothetical protein
VAAGGIIELEAAFAVGHAHTVASTLLLTDQVRCGVSARVGAV